MIGVIFIVSALGTWCDSYKKYEVSKDSKYMLSYNWIGGMCSIEKCSIPKDKVIIEDGMVLNGLAVIEDGTTKKCCDFDGRRDDLESFIPNLINHNYFYQSEISNYWSGYSECDIAAKSYVIHGTCLPKEYHTPYGYFNATLLLFQNYNVWTTLRHYNYIPGKQYVYSKQKINDLLSVRGFLAPVQWRCENPEDKQMLTSVNVCFTPSADKFLQTECPEIIGQQQCPDYFYFAEMPPTPRETKCAY
ncbi:hypothetical protein EHI8A_108260 [Entamoeba histolytica HM-1:IMSS-B]|uniref:Uncharacterized protein n=4 Tax=Entamoeba histolytica TaxID=5759 RepID=C4M083_ENTH1|nr:hypothetical protein EHI_004880 [Entamoeba histolytica HM-1:IMSS]EAL45315.1 hypothetical protein EHI_004880 [Entamoeba histolytica HM-1:IMSS]EMH75798.1 hypothetical protein EHI8A_108260 [Entamoeba histolytica HM-1:IMSS-B]ENY66017.1 hypothetical protein EHI7A_098130 [Entamoeba histolytica HM-1:IMSS-A]GAT94558.1 hypothetical protein CL6EHI_004880 [Entamoeba histolytica]|eukprot:XP_650702.1 hypothetical protein EHI_004880 [Entamoeba histolytica HM-1:IMSS]